MLSVATRVIAGSVLVLASLQEAAPAKPADVPLPTAKPSMDAVTEDDAIEVLPPGVPPDGQPLPEFELEEAKSCEGELRDLGVHFQVADEIDGPGACGVPRPVRVSRLASGISGTVKPGTTCDVARALSTWSQHVVKPAAKLHLGKTLSEVVVSTTYQCRRRNGRAAGKLSEHAFGNGIDVTSFRFTDGSTVRIAPRDGSDRPERAFQAAVRGGACAYFTTVIGPGTNEAHSNHLHLDLVERPSGFRLCE